MTERACKNCHFYCPSENKGDWDRWDGECRRNPPNNGFPGVNEDFWCGEFKSKIWVDGNGFPIKRPPKPRDLPPDTKTDNERWG